MAKKKKAAKKKAVGVKKKSKKSAKKKSQAAPGTLHVARAAAMSGALHDTTRKSPVGCLQPAGL